MKPRTKLEHLVTDLSKRLPNIISKHSEWAYRECLQHKAFANKSSAFCLDCGRPFPLELINRKRVTCPNCQAKLKVENTRKTTDKQITYFAIADVYCDFQIVRNFELFAYYKKGKTVKYFLHEILQYWITPQLKMVMIGLNHLTQGWCDSWTGDWSIRKERNRYYNSNKYKVYPYAYHPNSLFKDEYKKIGIDHHLDGLNVLDAIKTISKNPKAETLIKAKQYALLYRCRDYSSNISYNWASIKICLRNRYKVKDASLWLDYLDLLRYFHKDLHNSKYVCPKNLKKEHDRLVAKKREIQNKRKIEDQRKRIALENSDYVKEKKKYIGMVFTDTNITIKVLESVQEFLEEGDQLKHCLFANSYHKRKHSLILSAMVNGQRMETIEVCLKKYEVLQSRGTHNGHTEYHEDILKLINSNMHHIRSVKSRKSSKPDLIQNLATAV